MSLTEQNTHNNIYLPSNKDEIGSIFLGQTLGT